MDDKRQVSSESVAITLDRQRSLRFTTNSLVRLEEAIGIKASRLRVRITRLYSRLAAKDDDGEAMIVKAPEKAAEIMLESEDALESGTIRAMLWAGLLHEWPGLQVERAGELIDQTQGPGEQSGEDYVRERVTLAFLLRFTPSLMKMKAEIEEKMNNPEALKELLAEVGGSTSTTGETSDNLPPAMVSASGVSGG